MYKIEIKKQEIRKIQVIMDKIKSAEFVVENCRLYIQTEDPDIAAFLIYYLS